MSNLRQRSIFGALVVVLGALLFLLSSAYVIDRGYPKILAAIVGGLAFPVLPVAWQAWGERARKRKLADAKKPSKSTLNAFDRFWIRFALVAAVVLGPMIYVGRIEVPRAAIRHATWFLPELVPGIGTLGEGPKHDLTRVKPLLERVPGDAEVVVAWTPRDVHGEGILAFTNHDLLAAGQGDITRDDDTIRHINDYWKAQHFLMLDPIAMVIDRDLTVAASDRWKGKVEPAPNVLSSTLRRELERAPADAELFIALAPHAIKDAKTIRSGAIWFVRGAKGTVLEARLEAVDVAKAYQLIQDVKQLKPEALPIPANCRDKAAKLLGKLELAELGAVVTARIPVDADDFGCAN
ncbi:MAG: hypothetical protein ABI678_01830 [Kofleriaceae bacterium]